MAELTIEQLTEAIAGGAVALCSGMELQPAGVHRLGPQLLYWNVPDVGFDVQPDDRGGRQTAGCRSPGTR